MYLLTAIICGNGFRWIIDNEAKVNLRDGALIAPTRNIMPVRGMLVLRVTLDYSILEPAIEKVFVNTNVQHMLRTMGADLASCLPKTQKMHRRKRGAFDLGGEILKSIFGTATDKDMRSFQSEVQEHLNMHTIEIVNLHKINNETQDTLTLVAEELDRLNNDTKHIKNDLEALRLVVRIKTLCDNLHDITTDLEMGHVHLKNFNPQKIFKLIEYYSHRWNLQTLIDMYDQKFESTLASSVISQGNLKVGLIMIPFFPQEQFIGYKLIPFPMFTNNTNTQKVELVIKHKLIIFSHVKDKVFLAEEEFLSSCHKSYDDKLICPNFPLLSMSGKAQNICEVNVIANHNSANCKFTEVDKNYIKIIQISNSVIVSAIPEENVQLYCKDKEARPQHKGLIKTAVYEKNMIFQIPQSGIAIFPPTCKLVSKNIEYNPLLRKTMSMEFFYPKTLTNDIIQTHEEHPAHVLVNNIKRAINRTRTDIRDENHLEAMLTYRANVKHISISLSMFGSIVIICILVCFIWRYKTPGAIAAGNTTNTNTNTRTVPTDSERISLEGG